MPDPENPPAESSPCRDCACPAGQCLRGEAYLNHILQLRASEQGTDFYDTTGEYAHTEYRD
ncbi:hypothetical protein [Salmonirosea aquatica]|uniref:Uncharacterized protein n=1 Tax=Salmonirosea aquatica TaxID=2654236 RepID=A0A7C9FQ97_9BACT|nr:hypothetical protein [Cytophagaceae bacterium SJW1-29]